ncbi:XRE family transcriptional regulator [Cupriavidus sp. L7L]|uniref:helix-turn-helix domain-containing protein n=1 Tax=Cupriavidus sp. L7L TaxID=2546443 RepID=UPI001055277E|nr:XRE family transcriptional regulator [Cupriavidus sp. L7L]TDF62646.1 helix-turn-helix domain-containing protein [Cupriavidus sp. L7L]
MTDTSSPSTRTPSDPTDAISARVRIERESRGWSMGDLAERAGVSKAMISKIERGEASPTATVLGRLSGAFGLQLSMLLALAEQAGDRLCRAADQPVWTDPETGYTRRAVSPRNGGMLELVEIMLPANVRISYPSSAFIFQHQQIWVLQGSLVFEEGELVHRLEAGDCLQLGPPAPCTFINPGNKPCIYLVALVKR